MFPGFNFIKLIHAELVVIKLILNTHEKKNLYLNIIIYICIKFFYANN